MKRIRLFGWRQWLLILGLVLSLVVVVVFAIRALGHVPRPEVDEPIRPWMSVPYVAHSYHVPPHVLFQALGLPHKPPDERPIVEIARVQNRSVETVIADLQNAIVHARPPYPPPPPPPPDPTGSTP
jgi:hypothetical protein